MRATYKTMTIKENDIIRSDTFSCIAFQNVGTKNVYVNSILLKPNHSLSISEMCDTVIATDFNINFNEDNRGEDLENLLNVVMTYYKE